MAAGWADKQDNELLALIQDGTGQAFAVLVERHTDRFYRLAYRYLQSKAAAEDVVQDAFLKLWENPALWQPAAKQQIHHLVLPHRGQFMSRSAQEEKTRSAR